MVWCIGETVWEIILRGGKPVCASPGGSMLNTAVSLGRTGIPVTFVSDCGEDLPGGIVHRFLRENGVNTDFLHRHPGRKTTLSLAFLDNQKNASYQFYRDNPSGSPDQVVPSVEADDIILFGSWYALDPAVSVKVRSIVEQGRKNGAFVLYDPNFRKPHLHDRDRLLPAIMNNLSLANAVRGSDEDFLLIFALGNTDEVYQRVSPEHDKILILTRSGSPAEFRWGSISAAVPVPEITPVSTVGAGDGFNAGLIWYFTLCPQFPRLPDDKKDLHLKAAVVAGIHFAGDVCQQDDNYISSGFAAGLSYDQ